MEDGEKPSTIGERGKGGEWELEEVPGEREGVVAPDKKRPLVSLRKIIFKKITTSGRWPECSRIHV
jgi:hypothetical protein